MKQSIFFCLLVLFASCGGSDTPSEVKNNQTSATAENDGETSSEDETKSKYEFQVEDACGFDKSMVNETVYSFDSDREAESALKRVMRLTGLPANFEIRAASVPNAAAVIKCDRNGNNCNRYILYNQEFMEKVKDETKTNYAELAILAHEIAHHLSGHTISNTGSSYDMELEADKFAGFMLYKMGASISETKQSFSNLPIKGSSSHPPKSARIAAVTNGWYDAKRNLEPVSPISSTIKEQGSNNQVRNNPSSRNKSSLKVGSSYLGGLIYEINSSGTHGKVVKVIGENLGKNKFKGGYTYMEAMHAHANSYPWFIPDFDEYEEIYNTFNGSELSKYFDRSAEYKIKENGKKGGWSRGCGGSSYWIPNTYKHTPGTCKAAFQYGFCKLSEQLIGYCITNKQPLLLVRNF